MASLSTACIDAEVFLIALMTELCKVMIRHCVPYIGSKTPRAKGRKTYVYRIALATMCGGGVAFQYLKSCEIAALSQGRMDEKHA